MFYLNDPAPPNQTVWGNFVTMYPVFFKKKKPPNDSHAFRLSLFAGLGICIFAALKKYSWCENLCYFQNCVSEPTKSCEYAFIFLAN